MMFHSLAFPINLEDMKNLLPIIGVN